ncbi:translation initiation factor IF-2-like [Neovison vison]|uniref:translation initiation factor IF-2-like n=1 Tax=Neovison vison TaxID=452646 RepID=UPI001CEFCBC7|nr:translation initiation factor IF-2-like [Neogale vison]
MTQPPLQETQGLLQVLKAPVVNQSTRFIMNTTGAEGPEASHHLLRPPCPPPTPGHRTPPVLRHRAHRPAVFPPKAPRIRAAEHTQRPGNKLTRARRSLITATTKSKEPGRAAAGRGPVCGAAERGGSASGLLRRPNPRRSSGSPQQPGPPASPLPTSATQTLGGALAEQETLRRPRPRPVQVFPAVSPPEASGPQPLHGTAALHGPAAAARFRMSPARGPPAPADHRPQLAAASRLTCAARARGASRHPSPAPGLGSERARLGPALAPAARGGAGRGSSPPEPPGAPARGSAGTGGPSPGASRPGLRLLGEPQGSSAGLKGGPGRPPIR